MLMPPATERVTPASVVLRRWAFSTRLAVASTAPVLVSMRRSVKPT